VAGPGVGFRSHDSRSEAVARTRPSAVRTGGRSSRLTESGSSRSWIIFIRLVLPCPQGAWIPIVSGASVLPCRIESAIAPAYRRYPSWSPSDLTHVSRDTRLAMTKPVAGVSALPSCAISRKTASHASGCFARSWTNPRYARCRAGTSNWRAAR